MPGINEGSVCKYNKIHKSLTFVICTHRPGLMQGQAKPVILANEVAFLIEVGFLNSNLNILCRFRKFNFKQLKPILIYNNTGRGGVIDGVEIVVLKGYITELNYEFQIQKFGKCNFKQLYKTILI